MIEEFARLIPEEMRGESGRVFGSGREAFSTEGGVYVLGINPGGDPEDASEANIGEHTDFVLNEAPDRWSNYVDDEPWSGAGGRRDQMRERIRHLFDRIGVDPRSTPSSNLLFLRSRGEPKLTGPWRDALDQCWPFHAEVLRRLRPRAVLCFGRKPRKEVLVRLGGGVIVDSFVEDNGRRWPSHAHRTRSGPMVLGLTHPSRADWTTPEADPSPLVARTLDRQAP